MKKSKTLFKNDIILIIVILILAIALFFCFKLSLKTGNRAVVSVDGKQIFSLSLNEDVEQTVESENGTNVIEIRDGSVAVKSADCPDKICVKHRKISKTGETIICLPHKLVVEITEEG